MNVSVPTILCGDFNCVLDRSVDRRGSAHDDYSRESVRALTSLFDSAAVTDIWRYLHPVSSSFTWSRWDGTAASRIDLMGCPYAWLSNVSSSEIIPCPFSDHCAISMGFSIPETAPLGQGVWKLNTSILDDDEYTELINSFWGRWRLAQTAYPTLAKWWDAGKSRIKGITIAYCSQKTKKESATRDLLTRLACHLKSRVDAGFVDCMAPYRSTLAQLERLDAAAARGAQVRSRSRSRWIEEGESWSAFFLRQERKCGVDRRISPLRQANGSIVSSPRALCGLFQSFYSSLFSAEPVDTAAQDSLFESMESPLSEDQAEVCEGHLSMDECFAALNGMAHNKAPGIDSLPMEFYVKFWNVLGADLVLTLNSSFSASSLSLSQRRGLIILSHKKGDRLDPKNWRPITLLNVDYKIASRALAGRLLKVIHAVVAPDQSCGVPGRYIGENVSLLRVVVNYASSSDVPVAILSLDQEKAFDRVDWSFLRRTLRQMGFGPDFVWWVNLLYCGVQSAVNVNGHLSPFFSLSRGVRQGCPLSPLLYVLSPEVLACNIRANPSISGLVLPGEPEPLPVISQYAEDTTMVAVSDQAITAIFTTYSLFEKGSGSRLHLGKGGFSVVSIQFKVQALISQWVKRYFLSLQDPGPHLCCTGFTHCSGPLLLKYSLAPLLSPRSVSRRFIKPYSWPGAPARVPSVCCVPH